MNPKDFEAVVVGSGFGGSVVAYRLAAGKKRVCLLERGRAYPPGSFPRTPHAVKRALWDPSEGLYGIFDFWSFKGVEGLVSSALGGGSIIYANVFLRKDERWFVDEVDGTYRAWPVSRRDLERHYDDVEKAARRWARRRVKGSSIRMGASSTTRASTSPTAPFSPAPSAPTRRSPLRPSPIVSLMGFSNRIVNLNRKTI